MLGGLLGGQEHSFYSSTDGKTWNSVDAPPNGKDDKSIFDGDGEVKQSFQDENTKTLYVGGWQLGGGSKALVFLGGDGIVLMLLIKAGVLLVGAGE